MARKNVIRALAGTAGVLLVAGAAGPGAAAVTMEDSGDVQATVRKTVLQTATATGEILTSRMYTQVSAVGNGTKTVLVPVGATSNRNLNAFGPFPMEGESIQFDLTVDGGVEERTLTDADINPMEVSVKVTLDGVEIQPEDVVGASGVLDVQYTVRNTTATTSPVTYADVEGTEITEDLETADPYVGSLDVTLPQGFNEVTAPGATIAGNGQNQTSLGFTFVLFPPLGSPEVTVGYQARIDGGVMPPADFSFLPIVPFDNGQIAGTTDAYRGGAAVGAQIFGAGTEIGDNLLKLQDGASQLVSGLGQLAAGATQLSDGLVNTAAPGSAALADGADAGVRRPQRAEQPGPGARGRRVGAQCRREAAQRRRPAGREGQCGSGRRGRRAERERASPGEGRRGAPDRHQVPTDGYKQLKAALRRASGDRDRTPDLDGRS